MLKSSVFQKDDINSDSKGNGTVGQFKRVGFYFVKLNVFKTNQGQLFELWKWNITTVAVEITCKLKSYDDYIQLFIISK